MLKLKELYTKAAYKVFSAIDKLRPVGSLRWGYSVVHDIRLLSTAYGYKPLIIYDVGANDGRTYKEFREAFKSSIITSVEPNKLLWDELLRVATDDQNFILARCALGAAPGIGQMTAYAQSADHSCFDSNLSSLSDSPAFPELFQYAKHSSFEVTIDTIDNLSQSLGHRFIDVLKIDVEGYEPAVLKGATKLLKSFSVFIVTAEFSSVLDGQGRSGSLAAIAEQLEPFGFTMVSVCTDFVFYGKTPYANHNAIWVNPRACLNASSQA